MPMHGLILTTAPVGVSTPPIDARPEASRMVEALVPASGTTPVVDELLRLLIESALAYSVQLRERAELPSLR